MPYPFLKRWVRVSALTKNRSAKRHRCECVALNKLASRSQDWLASLAAGADRLVHPSVGGEPERAQHRRLVLIGLFVPVLMAAALVQTLAEPDRRHGDPDAGIGGHRLGLARRHLACRIGQDPDCRGRLACRCATLAAATVIAAAGGLSSPLALACARARRPNACGCGATAPALIAGAGSVRRGAAGCRPSSARFSRLHRRLPSAWHWFVPAAYLATIALRRNGIRGGARSGRRWHAGRPAPRSCSTRSCCGCRGRGEVLDASVKAEPLLGLQPGLLLGSGLFERVHVADRVAYLCALSDMREGAAARKLEVRLRAPRASIDESDEKYSDFALELADDRRCRPSRCLPC